MKTFEVVVIREGKVQEYRDFWDTSKRPQKGVDACALSFTETIEAKSKKEAEDIAQVKYPNCTIDRAATTNPNRKRGGW